MKKLNVEPKKAFVLFCTLVILSSLMCSCQIGQAQDNESTKKSTNITENAETDNTPQWKTTYLNFCEQKKDSHLSYALVYVDGDDIPELYLSGIDEATGDSICAYKNGTVVEQPLHRIGGGWYIEKSGNIINKNGHMGQLHTHAYKLNDAGFTLVFESHSSERIETLENGEVRLYFEYSIGDETVNEAEYNSAVNAVDADLDFENAVRLNENEVEYDLIVQQIRDYR